MKANEESGSPAYPALLELARGMPTEELAHYVERGRKGVKRSRAALQAIERRIRDREVSGDNNVLPAMQQKAQRELKRCEHILNIATTVLGERRQQTTILGWHGVYAPARSVLAHCSSRPAVRNRSAAVLAGEGAGRD
jgi:hypothetical protein